MIFNGLTNDDKDKLRKAITSDNIGSQSVASATTVNGHTVNKDVPANAVFTDTNTWRPVEDNLTSTSTSNSLSANQGRVLNANKIDKTSSNRPGVTKLYRRDENTDYSVQTHWDGSRWFLRGYYGDTFHAECRVAYSDAANTAVNSDKIDGYHVSFDSSTGTLSFTS